MCMEFIKEYKMYIVSLKECNMWNGIPEIELKMWHGLPETVYMLK